MTSVSVNTTLTASRKESFWWKYIGHHLNFYRVHLLVFTFTPILFSVVFYLSNGQHKISYVDSLFNCVSAMMVCGLATVDLSSCTGFQQALLFIQMCIGNPVIVSWVMVLIRKFFFAKKFEHMLQIAAAKDATQTSEDGAKKQPKPWHHRLLDLFSGRHISVVDEESLDGSEKHRGVIGRLRPDMIRRMDDAPKLVNPSGWLSEGSVPKVLSPPVIIRAPSLQELPTASKAPSQSLRARSRSASVDARPPRLRRLSDPGQGSRPASPTAQKMHRFETLGDVTPSPTAVPKQFPRTHTVEFAPPPRRPARLGQAGVPVNGPLDEEPSPTAEQNRTVVNSPEIRSISMRGRRPSIGQPMSINTHQTHPTLSSMHDLPKRKSKHRGYGGFPWPWTFLRKGFRKVFPVANSRLARTMTIPATISLAPSRGGDSQAPGTTKVPYISFEAVVGRNSAFHLLTTDQLDEVGGIEYRALNVLVWIVPAYHILFQLIGFIIIAPYISQPRWQPVFKDEQTRPLNSVWFTAFQVVSAYTNTGMSLVDQSMVPFQQATLMILVMIVLVLAGNTSFPIFLRFSIWCLTKVINRGSRLNETLHFLLDHPRRCFMYLFPSHQTWFLLTVVLGLTFIDWFFFLVLDINDPAIDSIPLRFRVLDGLMQAIAVRAAGFGIVPLAALAPAVKVLYVVMMYISVYPIAMSVRSTNVYEEKSLGIFNDINPDEENTFQPSGSRLTVWSNYLALHARRQLAFDMWWMALSLFLICIVERRNLENPEHYGWFNIFNIMFELVSAYGTVGLSLGTPSKNYSFVGVMHPLSKLIICVVMLRGRHRGLPVAIDRAIMLSSDKVDEADIETRSRMSAVDFASTALPFRYTDTMMSHRSTSGASMRQRQPHRYGSRTFQGDEVDVVLGKVKYADEDGAKPNFEQ